MQQQQYPTPKDKQLELIASHIIAHKSVYIKDTQIKS